MDVCSKDSDCGGILIEVTFYLLIYFNKNHSKLSRSSWINAEPSIFKDGWGPTKKLRYHLTLNHVGLCCMPGSAVTNLIHN